MKKHIRNVQKHQKASARSLSLFSQMMDSLNRHNEQLDSAIKDIEADINRLQTLKLGAHITKLQNTKSAEHIANIIGRGE